MSKPNDVYRTSRNAIFLVLTSLLNLKVSEIVRMKTGESNKVYKVNILDNCTSYIFKIQHSDWEDLNFENKLKDKARAAGVLVPKTFFVGEYDFGKGENQQYEVQEFLPYENAHEYKNEIIYSEILAQERFLLNAGVLMKSLHSITFDTFGSKREGEICSNFYDYKTRRLESWQIRNKALNGTIDLGFDGGLIKNLVLEKYKSLDISRPTLCHMDIEPGHLFVKEDMEITALIDFGNYRISSYHEDFAWWSFWQKRLPIDAICRGYGIENIESFKKTIIPFRLEIGVMLADYFHQFENKEGLEYCIQKIASDYKMLSEKL